MSKVILVTGAARGMGVDIAKAALAAGHRVVGHVLQRLGHGLIAARHHHTPE